MRYLPIDEKIFGSAMGRMRLPGAIEPDWGNIQHAARYGNQSEGWARSRGENHPDGCCGNVTWRIVLL
jgi:hypothetical protein